MANKTPHIFLTGHPGVGKTTIIKAVQSFLSLCNNNNRHEDTCTGMRMDSDKDKKSTNIVTRGFLYTEEFRSKNGDRVGFDIVYCASKSLDHHPEERKPRREALSRIQDKIKRSDPHVGNYLVSIHCV